MQEEMREGMWEETFEERREGEPKARPPRLLRTPRLLCSRRARRPCTRLCTLQEKTCLRVYLMCLCLKRRPICPRMCP